MLDICNQSTAEKKNLLNEYTIEENYLKKGSYSWQKQQMSRLESFF